MFIVSKQVNLKEGKNFHFNTWEIEVEDEELMFESISPGLPCVPITFQCAGRIKEYENPQEEFGRLAWLAFILPSPVAVLMAQAAMLSYFQWPEAGAKRVLSLNSA